MRSRGHRRPFISAMRRQAGRTGLSLLPRLDPDYILNGPIFNTHMQLMLQRKFLSSRCVFYFSSNQFMPSANIDKTTTSSSVFTSASIHLKLFHILQKQHANISRNVRCIGPQERDGRLALRWKFLLKTTMIKYFCFHG